MARRIFRHVTLRRVATAVACLSAMLIAAGLLCDRWFPLDFQRMQTKSVVALDRDGEPLRLFLSADGAWRLEAAVPEVDPLYLDMLVAYEDQRFQSHPGIDPVAIGRAILQWIGNGHVVSGASTLTMQTARLLEPRPRTMAAKLADMGRALQLELHHSKPEILDIYLTLAPYGGNLEGIRAASLAYFDKEPWRLTEAEAALLVALPRAPEQLRPDRYPDAALAARNRVLDIAAARGVIDPLVAEDAKVEAIPDRRHALPFLAPHLTERLAATLPPGTFTLATTIDRDIQSGLEELLKRRASGLGADVGIAAIVVHTPTMEVRGYAGAADYFDESRRGMINMAAAIRSPGSTLKPFIYGIGFDRLLIHPDTVIADTPRDFDGYVPINFDDGFHGDVTVREALQRSLNIPAVMVLNRVGPLSFDAALRQVGVTPRFDRSKDAASLPLALGGIGLTLEELVTLYAALPAAGKVRPLVFAPGEPGAAGLELFGPAAAWYVSDALSGVAAPAGYADRAGAVRFKTGTSYGYRDAWAIGFAGDYTIGVWIGRPDGTPCNACIGIKAAAPVLFRIADLLPASLPPHLAPPADVIPGPTSALPPALRRFESNGTYRATVAHDSNRLSITFPVDGSRLKVARRADGLAPVALRANGGVGQLRWFVNGAPLAPTERWTGDWIPDGAGFADIEAMDSEGRSAKVEVFIEPAVRD